MIVASLLILAALAVAGLVLTSAPGQESVLRENTSPEQPATLVDQRSLQTARRLAALARSAEEHSSRARPRPGRPPHTLSFQAAAVTVGYCRLAGGMIPFIRRYTAICP